MNALDEFNPITLRASDVASIADACTHLRAALAALQSLQLPTGSVVNQNAAGTLETSKHQLFSLIGVVSHWLERSPHCGGGARCH